MGIETPRGNPLQASIEEVEADILEVLTLLSASQRFVAKQALLQLLDQLATEQTRLLGQVSARPCRNGGLLAPPDRCCGSVVGEGNLPLNGRLYSWPAGSREKEAYSVVPGDWLRPPEASATQQAVDLQKAFSRMEIARMPTQQNGCMLSRSPTSPASSYVAPQSPVVYPAHTGPPVQPAATWITPAEMGTKNITGFNSKERGRERQVSQMNLALPALKQHGAVLAVESADQLPPEAFTALSTCSWEQSEDKIKIYVPLRGVSAEILRPTFTPHTVDVKIVNLKDKHYRFFIPDTFQALDPSRCSAAVSKTKKNILITLQKQNFASPEEKHWPDLHSNSDAGTSTLNEAITA